MKRGFMAAIAYLTGGAGFYHAFLKGNMYGYIILSILAWVLI
ncbi:hypothetical protein [Lysinibacillus odysseyi]|nr:hypothetical protein [Lysinibacillus odysseyi]